MRYDPSPIDTSHVDLTEDLRQFAELLAHNNHDVWARHQKRLGWGWGPVRNDNLKEHPNLVPYDDLPENEKEYDRITAAELLKSVLAVGGTVELPPDPGAGHTSEQSRKSRRASLLDSWRSRRRRRLARDDYRKLAEGMLELHEPLLAFDIASEGLRNWSSDVRLCQIKALALARTGSLEDAETILNELKANDGDDQETLLILAYVHKEFGLSATTERERQRRLRSACAIYSEAYSSGAGYMTGINAATLSLLMGETTNSKRLAEQVRDTCLDESRNAEHEDYWLEATLGEAELILQRWTEAEKHYMNAARNAGDDPAWLTATGRNAHLILTHWNKDTASFDRCFPIPKIAVFAGHRVDRLGRPQPRFPADPAFETAVRAHLQQQLRALDVRIGFASAASGSDILFLETVRELGGRFSLVLPCKKDQFVRESVADGGAQWAARFEDLYQAADEVILASNQRLTAGSLSYDYANLLLYGLAQVRAEQLDTALVRLAVWDGKPGDGPGGTADIVSRWRQHGEVHVINPLEVQTGSAAAITLSATPDQAHELPRNGGCIVAMLFSDVEKFSSLTDEQIPLFVEHFLRGVANLRETSKHAPQYANTWGDGLFLVFSHLESAGEFAFELLDLVKTTDWENLGLRSDLELRIALHAGPVYEYEDPFRNGGGANYIGTHVNRAARMEPVTPAGYIYVSQAFASLAREQGLEKFEFVYAGETELPKSAGLVPMYAMRPAALLKTE